MNTSKDLKAPHSLPAEPGVLAMLHTVPGLIPQLEALASSVVPGVSLLHFVDEALLQDTIAAGVMTNKTQSRVADYTRFAAEIGADVLVVTCSSIGEAAAAADGRDGIPVLRIDAPMADLAVKQGKRIGVLATLEVTLGPTTRLIEDASAGCAVRPAVISRKIDGAFDALRAGDREKHDDLVRAAFSDLAEECDVVLLAQASMARALEASNVSVPNSVRVLTSPESGIAQIADYFSGGRA